MPPSLLRRLELALYWAILTFVSVAIRPLMPVDETRYAAVAWEMWQRDDFLVPHLNGETYSHKPPLLFWLMHLSWWLFGINDWSIRVIAPMFSLASLYLAQSVAKLLWPERTQVAELVPYLLLGCLFWMVYGTLTMFDIMLSFFALLGIYAIALNVCAGLSYKHWALLGIAIAGGVLTKGPVILLHVLPMALLSPWFLLSNKADFSKKAWYFGVIFAIILGAVIALCWAIPAGLSGGDSYRKAIFLGQTSGRIVDSFAHKLPFWWYLQLLPLILMPWLFIPTFWLGYKQINKQDFGLRFCAVWVMPVSIAFSLVSGKRIHYLLPLMPAITLVLTWVLVEAKAIEWRKSSRYWRCILALLGILLIALPFLDEARYIKSQQVDFAQLSPSIGLLMLLVALLLHFFPPNNAKQLVKTVCVSTIFMALILAKAFFQLQGDRYDMTPPAEKIASLLAQDREVGFVGSKYHGQFHFAGRLTKPIALLHNKSDVIAFAQHNPTGYLVVEFTESVQISKSVVSFSYPFKSRSFGFIACESLLAQPVLIDQLKPS